MTRSRDGFVVRTRTGRRPGRLGVVSVTVALALFVPPVGARSAEAPDGAGDRPARLRFVAFNICGGLCNDGTVDEPGADNDVVEHVVSVLTDFEPHVAVLNEVCGAQFHRLVRLLQESNHPMSAGFHAQRSGELNCPAHEGVRDFGDAVLTSGTVDGHEVHRLPNRPSGRERRSLLCLRTTHHGTTFLACGLHLVAGEPRWHPRQLDETVRFTRERSQYLPVVLAGDFNIEPWGMGQLTDPDQGGFHTDVDHADEDPTVARRKIDYVLVPNGRFRDLDGEARPSSWSDHHMVVGWATLRP